MMRRIPVVPTLLVLAAVGVMIRLGFWQLDRLHQKEALLARYAAALKDESIIKAGPGFMAAEPYRKVRLQCDRPKQLPPIAGHNRSGVTGWAHRVNCDTRDFDIISSVDVTLGWSNSPMPVAWKGGVVTGMTAPGSKWFGYIVADPPLAGLEANAKPDPRDIPNNHLSYAIQWFLFAATALVIYALALRKRWKSQATD